MLNAIFCYSGKADLTEVKQAIIEKGFNYSQKALPCFFQHDHTKGYIEERIEDDVLFTVKMSEKEYKDFKAYMMNKVNPRFKRCCFSRVS